MSGLINTQIILSKDIPSESARKLLNNEVDIGLIPVAVIPQLKESYIISDYCIGANGAVNSVMLYSEVPLKQIKQIYLDYQSKTSVQLVKILCKEFWNINPLFIAAEKGFENTISGNIAAVVIGDRTFELNHKFPFVFDLSQEWKHMTGRPFVFACWVSNKKIADNILKPFNTALKLGINSIDQCILQYNLQEKYPTNVSEYLKKYIQYNFGIEQKNAIELFLSKI